jgi:hypothetical protein
LGAAAFLIHDAGHSLNEVMWTVNNRPQKLSIDALEHLVEAAGDTQPAKTYADFAAEFSASPEVQGAISRALQRLAGYTPEPRISERRGVRHLPASPPPGPDSAKLP